MKTKINRNQKWKYPNMVFKIFFVLIWVLFLQYAYISLSGRVYKVDILAFAENRNTYSTTLYSNRGTIYDNENNILAINVSSYTVIAYLNEKRSVGSNKPLHVEDKENTAKALSPILNMTEEHILSLLNYDAYQVELGPGGRGISELVKEEIETLELPGIDFIESQKRYYPNGDFASYLIGYAKTNEKKAGKEIIASIDGELGIESKYDEILKGVNGYLKYQQDLYGYKIPGTNESRIEAIDGSNIYLTTDSSIQRFLEASVKDTVSVYDPEWMMISVMDAKTGDILGSATSPSFNPNIRNIENYENPLISYIFEPGSTMKTFTYMCAIESGKYDGSSSFVSGKYKLGKDTIADWNGKGWGKISYDLGFEYSSNVGIANLLNEVINKNELKDCLDKYGFGTTTDIELNREQAGKISFNYPIEVAAAGYGQGISTTAIQIMQGLTLISNNGKMLKPHIISKIVDPNTNEVTYERKIEESEQLVSTKTVKKIKELMYNVINNNNEGTTGTRYKLDGFDVIGKTGTAQIYDNKTKRYLTGNGDYIYSFTGMFPKDNPEIIIYSVMKKPKTISGSTVLAKATTPVMASIAKYLNINSNKSPEQNIKEYIIPSYTNKDVDDTIKELKDNKIKTIIIGDGNRIIDQYPNKDSKILTYDKVFLKTNSKNIVMPDLAGLSRIEVTKLMDLIDFPYNIEGYGYVSSQSVKSGSSLLELENTPIEIVLEGYQTLEE